jgi:hypothetical protein
MEELAQDYVQRGELPAREPLGVLNLNAGKLNEEEIAARKIEKPCNVCRIVKPTNSDHFHKDASDPTGFFRTCRDCQKAYRKTVNRSAQRAEKRAAQAFVEELKGLNLTTNEEVERIESYWMGELDRITRDRGEQCKQAPSIKACLKARLIELGFGWCSADQHVVPVVQMHRDGRRCLPCVNGWNAAHRAKDRRHKEEDGREDNYGAGIQLAYNFLLELQAHECPICCALGIPPEQYGGPTCCEHRHRSEGKHAADTVTGVLCGYHNKLMGRRGDSIRGMRKRLKALKNQDGIEARALNALIAYRIHSTADEAGLLWTVTGRYAAKKGRSKEVVRVLEILNLNSLATAYAQKTGSSQSAQPVTREQQLAEFNATGTFTKAKSDMVVEEEVTLEQLMARFTPEQQRAIVADAKELKRQYEEHEQQLFRELEEDDNSDDNSEEAA